MTDPTITDALACDWCGNTGHTPDAHPLPTDHPHFDSDLDDNPLLDLALGDFLDWQEEQTAPKKSIPPAPQSPISRLLGAGPDVVCNELVHWWPAGDAQPGDPCICGQRRKGQNDPA